MVTGLLATVLIVPAQPPAAPAPVVQVQPAPAAKPSAPPAGGSPTPAPPGGGTSATPAPTPAAPAGGDGCSPAGCAPAEADYSFTTTHNGPPWVFWGGVDYRMMWLRPARSAGVLALAGARPFGLEETEFGRTNGVGFDFGAWLNDRHTWGLTAGGFLLEQKSRTMLIAGGPGGLVRPFTDALTNAPATFVVADPAAGIRGGLGVSQGIRLSGFEVGGVNNLLRTCNWSADFLAGFRYLDLDEFLTVTQASAVPAAVGLSVAGVAVDRDRGLTVTDRFRTRNQFYGPQVGLRGEYRAGGFFASLSGKVGLGNVVQRVDVDGRTDVTGRPGVPGGLLASGAALGGSNTNRFAVLADVGVGGGYQFAPWGRAKVGYDFLYLNDVVRPGQQVDRVVNTRFVPASRNFDGVAGVTAPVPTGRTDDFFAHGFRVGLELLY